MLQSNQGNWFWENLCTRVPLETIWFTLAYASFEDFKLLQMDVKSAFLNDFIKEEVYVGQTLGSLIIHIPIMFLK